MIALMMSLAMLADQPASVSRQQVDAMVHPYVTSEYVTGLAVGIIDRDGPRVLGYGRIRDGQNAAPGGATVFEIGSSSKVFTGLLLSILSQQKAFALDDPVQQYLPDSVKLAVKGEKPVSLLDLAAHRSGLPRMPSNFAPTNPNDPYASYTPQQMYDFLNSWKPRYDPGSHIEYSNLGMGLLGHAMSRRTNQTYEQLVVIKISKPLRMNDTSVELSADQKQRLAQPHDADGNPTNNWNIRDPFAGAGAIRSTPNDMLKFLQAQIDPPADELGGAIKQSQIKRNKFDGKDDIAMGWLIEHAGFLRHNGETGGYHSFIAFHAEKKVGVAVLANCGGGAIDEIGMRLIRTLIGDDPGPTPKLRLPIKLSEEKLDRFVGEYQLIKVGSLKVTRDGDRVMAQLTNQPAFRVYPDSETSFFWKVVDARAEIEIGPEGKAGKLTLHQNGMAMPMMRVAATQPAKAPQ